MISIKDILDKNQVTKESLFKTFTDLATAAKVPVSALGPLEPLRAFVEQLCEWLALVWNGYLLNVIRGGFLDTAEGVFLTILAWTMFGVARRTETFGHADAISLENRGGGVYSFAPGDVRIKNGANKTFHNVTSGSLAGWSGSGAYPTVKLDFEADEAGSGSNTLAGQISTTPVTAPADVYVITNDDPVYADDDELDEPLRERCRLAVAPLSPGGPAAAVELLARSARRADGSFVDVTRVRIVEPGDEVYVYLAGGSGASSGNTATEGSDVYIANQRIQVYAAKAGVKTFVLAATEKTFTANIAIVIDIDANLTAKKAKTSAEAAVALFFKTLKIGGARIVEGGVGYVVAKELGAKVSECEIGIVSATVDAGDLELAVNEVAVPVITFTISLVTQ